MVWFVFALSTAFFEGMKNLFSKKSFTHVDEYAAAWGMRFFATLFLLPVLLYMKFPSFGQDFWIVLVINGVLNLFAQVLFMKALKESDLSISTPILSFTPLFLLFISPLLLNEMPRLLGIAGVLLIVAGAYTLQIGEVNKGLLAPFKSLFNKSGPRLMLLVAFIWSITSAIDKIGVKNSSPFAWAFAVSLFITVFLTPIVLLRKEKSGLPRGIPKLVPIGFFNALTLIFHMVAISLTFVTYVISIKRLSALVDVFSGHLILKEKGFGERVVGTLMMIVGVIIIAVS